jgi:hypothetical protein
MGSSWNRSEAVWRSRAWRSAAGVGLALELMACADRPALVASADPCMAACNLQAADGDSCLVWSTLAPASCVSRYSAVDACCGPADRPACALFAPLASGAPCVCRASDARGPYVVQGSACSVH